MLAVVFKVIGAVVAEVIGRHAAFILEAIQLMPLTIVIILNKHTHHHHHVHWLEEDIHIIRVELVAPNSHLITPSYTINLVQLLLLVFLQIQLHIEVIVVAEAIEVASLEAVLVSHVLV